MNGRKQLRNHQSYGFMAVVVEGKGILLCFLDTIPLAMFQKFRLNLLILLTDLSLIIIIYLFTQITTQLTYKFIDNIQYNTHIQYTHRQYTHRDMLKNINIPQSQMPLPQRLLPLCKKSTLTSDNKPQIDYILLDRQMQQLQHIQSKTVQQIVQFVDEHIQQFIQINKKFQNIQTNISQSQLIIKKIVPKLDAYKQKIFSPQSKIQQYMANYQKKLITQQLTQIAKQQTQFLLDFIHDFEHFININIEQLNHKHKYNIVRLLNKKEFIKTIFQHPLIQNVSNCTNDLSIMLGNITEQLEFYLSEQLSRIATSAQLRNLRQGGLSLLQEIQLWYQYMGKDQVFYQIIQQTIIGRKLSTLELLLTSHKQNLIGGSEENIENIVKQFFNDLFQLVEEFPTNYPLQRILKIIYKFLGKKQLNFIYSYVVPTFPISYSAYKTAVSNIRNQALRTQLETKHGWNLKLWADLRIKTIMDRSGKDKNKTLVKWLDIVFKKNFMIHGVKNHMVKLAFLLINRHCTKIQEEIEFNSKNLNQNYNIYVSVKETLKARLFEGFAEQLNDGQEINSKIMNESIQKIIQNATGIIQKTIRKWIVLNMQMVINSCKNSLQPFRTFVLNIISRKDKHKVLPNNKQNILKPLRGYFKNNPQISQDCSKYLQKITMELLQVHYDSEYAKQIYNHCQSNISTQQMKLVMEIVAVQRQSLFENNIQIIKEKQPNVKI